MKKADKSDAVSVVIKNIHSQPINFIPFARPDRLKAGVIIDVRHDESVAAIRKPRRTSSRPSWDAGLRRRNWNISWVHLEIEEAIKCELWSACWKICRT